MMWLPTYSAPCNNQVTDLSPRTAPEMKEQEIDHSHAGCWLEAQLELLPVTVTHCRSMWLELSRIVTLGF